MFKESHGKSSSVPRLATPKTFLRRDKHNPAAIFSDALAITDYGSDDSTQSAEQYFGIIATDADVTNVTYISTRTPAKEARKNNCRIIA